MKSTICLGQVGHERLDPALHRFRHAVWFVAVDLDELPRLDREVSGFGYNRLNPAALHDRDYLDPGDEPLRAKLNRRLAQGGVADMPCRVVLVTCPRLLHYVFNPVSFYLCFGSDERLIYVLAEVNNTFGDRHLYLVRDLALKPDTKVWVGASAKVFHVSPFNNMEGGYQFSFSHGPEGTDIGVAMERGGQIVFRARISGEGAPFTAERLRYVLRRRPLAALLTMPRILLQAARLRFLKHLPVYRRPEPHHPMTILNRSRPC